MITFHLIENVMIAHLSLTCQRLSGSFFVCWHKQIPWMEKSISPVQKKIQYQIWCNTASNIFMMLRTKFYRKNIRCSFIYSTSQSLYCLAVCLSRPLKKIKISCCGVYGSRKHVNISSVTVWLNPSTGCWTLTEMPLGTGINQPTSATKKLLRDQSSYIQYISILCDTCMSN